jgi:hypothetical protein
MPSSPNDYALLASGKIAGRVRRFAGGGKAN